MTTSDDLLDAALAVVGVTGVSGLTFDGVDDQANVEPGTTAETFATMEALIDAMLGRIITLDGVAWMSSGGELTPTSVAEFADRMANLTITQVHVSAASTMARFALFFGSPQAVSYTHLDVYKRQGRSAGSPTPPPTVWGCRPGA